MMFAILLLLLLPTTAANASSAEPVARQGILNAADWSPESGNLVLNGEWGFSWQRFDSPAQRRQPGAPWFVIPSTWDSSGTAGWHHSGQGYASFYLKVTQLPPDQEFAVFVPEVSTAFRLFANGKLITQGGRVATEARDAEAYIGNRWAVLGTASGNELNLVLEVSNFHHNSGGPWQPIELGLRQSLTEQFYFHQLYDALISLLMIIMAGLLILEYLVDPKDRAGLWLGLLALALGLRIGIVGNAPFYWLLDMQLPWTLHMRLAYVSMLISPLFFLAWIHNSFPQDLKRGSSVLISLPFALCVLLCLVLPTLWFTQLLGLFSIMLLLLVLIGCLLLLQISWRRRDGSLLLFTGLIALAGSVVHDLMLNNQLIQGSPWIGTGLLLFILTQTSNFLSLRVRQRRQIEFLSHELASANRELERRVELRTRDLADKAHALEMANNQLQVLANVDGLTGLLNRRAFIEQMKQLGELSVNVALLWIDLDHFKHINDHHGHVAGDHVLKRFGQLLRELARDQDRIGRLGGEEFALLLLDCDQPGAVVYARRLQAALTQLHFDEYPNLRNVTASIGIAIGRLGEDSWEELLIQADEAMYDVKRTGRNSYCVS